MTGHSKQKQPIDMSLRLWSDFIPLKPILDKMGIDSDFLHVPGQLKIKEGKFSGSIADRHYASVVNVRGENNKDISIWFENLLTLLEKNSYLVNNFKDGSILGLIWIAILYKTNDTLHLDGHKVDKFHSMNLKIMIEDYNNFDLDGNPKKIWI